EVILVIDNYDSFTFNLVQYLAEISNELIPIKVVRNDELSVDQIKNFRPSHIVISPGPCTPNEAGVSISLVKELSGTLPILGVCLGHQAIVQAFGGVITRASRIMHGKNSRIEHSGESIFTNIPNYFTATRYHSLIADTNSLPSELEVLAYAKDDPDEIMAVYHRRHRATIGLQFHPEAILTKHGKELLKNFINLGATNNV
ncbi:UNVERIFIED_CONTAM: hypothetical protein GTU68_015194, partial [Idotea baltica]|nr:hypothetical protein [Idotea baltica]